MTSGVARSAPAWGLEGVSTGEESDIEARDRLLAVDA